MSAQAATLRNRADHLRQLAAVIERTPAMGLDGHAGVNTWHGPRPDSCETDLRACQQRVHGAAEALRTQAWSFEQQAAEIEAAAALAARAEAERAARAAAEAVGLATS